MRLKSGALGRAAVPSGASTGEFEATELRDGGPEWAGKGVGRAVKNVNDTIAKALVGARATDQVAIDETLRELDGTPNKSRLGANAILGVSLATARAAALEAEVPLYIYVAELSGLSRDQATVLPVPMMNVINGGAHADNSVDLQEFMVVPAGAPTYSDGLRMGTEIFHALKATLKERGLGTTVGDEGGFAPDLESNEAALAVLVDGNRGRRLRPGRRRVHRPRPGDQRALPRIRRRLRARARGPGAERRGDDRLLGRAGGALPGDLDRGRDGGGGLGRLGSAHQAPRRLAASWSATTSSSPTPSGSRRGIEAGVGNSILVKVNQIGTLTETLEAIAIARDAGYSAVISHRSGETEDTTIADIAVGTRRGADQDRRAVALGPRGEVQPAAADRGGARRERHLPGIRELSPEGSTPIRAEPIRREHPRPGRTRLPVEAGAPNPQSRQAAAGSTGTGSDGCFSSSSSSLICISYIGPSINFLDAWRDSKSEHASLAELQIENAKLTAAAHSAAGARRRRARRAEDRAWPRWARAPTWSAASTSSRRHGADERRLQLRPGLRAHARRRRLPARRARADADRRAARLRAPGGCAALLLPGWTGAAGPSSPRRCSDSRR